MRRRLSLGVVLLALGCRPAGREQEQPAPRPSSSVVLADPLQRPSSDEALLDSDLLKPESKSEADEGCSPGPCPESPQARKFYRAGQRIMRRGDYEVALRVFETARELEPDNIASSLAAAKAARKANELVKADKIWTDIFAKHSVNAEWRHEYAELLVLQGRHDEAKRQLEIAGKARRNHE